MNMNGSRVLLIMAGIVAMTLLPAAKAQTIYWVESSFSAPMLAKANGDGSGVERVPLTSGSSPEGLAINLATSKLYWSELAYVNAKINRATISLTDETAIFSDGSVLRGITVDPIADQMYWSTSNLASGAMIFRAGLDGSARETLIVFDASLESNPRGISVVNSTSKMYWADFEFGSIRSAATTAGASPVDVLTGLDGPVGIAIDSAGTKIYWTEANTGTVNMANIDGTSPTVLVTGLSSPNYLALDEVGGKLFWTELGTNGIKRANLDGSNVTDLGITADFPQGIAVTPSAPLAVQLSAFNAYRVGTGDVIVEWETVSETNNYGFVVERRDQGPESNFEAVSPFIGGAGTSLEEHSYRWVDENAGSGSYVYRVRQMDLNGDVSYSPEVEVSALTGVADGSSPARFSLSSNYPNPFNPETQVAFELPSSSMVMVRVYDVTGRTVATLVEGRRDAGNHEIRWNAVSQPSGVYYCRMTAVSISEPGTTYSSMIKMTLAR